MSRPLRIKFNGAWYHVMNRGLNRQNIYFNDAHRITFLKYLEKTVKIYGVEVHAYCLMGNHYHLIAHTPRGNISEAIKYLNSAYARYLNIDLKRDGPVFRGRFHAIVISEDSYLLKLSRYIHRNPLSQNAAKNLAKYKWSSYPAYIGESTSPKWLSTREVISRFGEIGFIFNYKQHVEADNNDDICALIEKPNTPPALGDDDFIKRIDQYVSSHSLSAEIVGAKRIIAQPDIQELGRSIALYFNLDLEILRTSTIGIKSTPRNITIYICREFGGYSLPVIAKYMGVSCKAISAVLNRVKNNNEQMKIVTDLTQQLHMKSKKNSDVC